MNKVPTHLVELTYFCGCGWLADSLGWEMCHKQPSGKMNKIILGSSKPEEETRAGNIWWWWVWGSGAGGVGEAHWGHRPSWFPQVASLSRLPLGTSQRNAHSPSHVPPAHPTKHFSHCVLVPVGRKLSIPLQWGCFGGREGPRRLNFVEYLVGASSVSSYLFFTAVWQVKYNYTHLQIKKQAREEDMFNN